MHKTSVIDSLTYVQNIMQPSFVGAFDVVGPIGICLQCLCHNPALATSINFTGGGGSCCGLRGEVFCRYNGFFEPPPQSSIETMSLDCLVFEKTAFCVRVSGDIQTDR